MPWLRMSAASSDLRDDAKCLGELGRNVLLPAFAIFESTPLTLPSPMLLRLMLPRIAALTAPRATTTTTTPPRRGFCGRRWPRLTAQCSTSFCVHPSVRIGYGRTLLRLSSMKNLVVASSVDGRKQAEPSQGSRTDGRDGNQGSCVENEEIRRYILSKSSGNMMVKVGHCSQLGRLPLIRGHKVTLRSAVATIPREQFGRQRTSRSYLRRDFARSDSRTPASIPPLHPQASWRLERQPPPLSGPHGPRRLRRGGG